MLRQLIAFALALAASLAAAQAPSPSPPPSPAWPDNAQSLDGDSLRAKVAGKTFKAAGATMRPARLQYNGNGFVFLDVSTGFRDTGKWRVEGTNLCTDWQKAPSSGCGEVRVAGDVLYIRRTNGDLMTFTPD